MSALTRTYLSLGLALAFAGACAGEDLPLDKDTDSSRDESDRENDSDLDTDPDESDAEDPADEDNGNDDNDDDDAVDEAPTRPVDGGRTDASPRDGGTAAADSGRGSDGGSDAGAADAGSDSESDAETEPDLQGECCEDGDCLCHGPAPTELTSSAGPFKTAQLRVAGGTVHYPTDAEPPFAVVAVCGGFLNTGPEMASWGPFYASHGIVTVITTTSGADIPGIRAGKLLAALDQVQAENTKSGSPLFEKLSDRMGTSGYSMGGGGTTIASADRATLKTSVGLAPWGGTGAGVQVPTLVLCGTADSTAPCSMSQSVYRAIPEGTPKMMVSISGVSHFGWFGPTDAGRGTSGAYALAFQKVYLEGDERWKSLLVSSPSNGMMTTNIE